MPAAPRIGWGPAVHVEAAAEPKGIALAFSPRVAIALSAAPPFSILVAEDT